MIYNSHYLLIFIFAMNAHLRELLGSVMFSPSIIVAEVLLKCSLQEAGCFVSRGKFRRNDGFKKAISFYTLW